MNEWLVLEGFRISCEVLSFVYSLSVKVAFALLMIRHRFRHSQPSVKRRDCAEYFAASEIVGSRSPDGMASEVLCCEQP